jgi:ribose/xylose/arabinose/galactoside ABC-type transport system permease subunit
MSTTVLAKPKLVSHRVSRVVERNGLLLFCLLLTAGAAIFAPGFRSPNNLQNVLTNAAPLGVVVLGQCLVILVRGFDLSVASVMATAAVVATSFDYSTDWSVIPILAVSLVMALVVGSVNGYLVTQRRVSPFLATLAVMIVLQGIRFAWTKGAPSGRVPELIRVIGSQAIHSVPINLILLVILAVFVGVMLERTAFGRKIYMVGGNPRAAELVGVNVNWITFLCYVLSAILAALGGLVLVGYVGSVDNWVGRGYELNSIIATVMGGVSLGGGRGSVFGALVGAFVLTEIFNIALLLGFPVQFQWVVKGVVILLAVAVYLGRVERNNSPASRSGVSGGGRISYPCCDRREQPHDGREYRIDRGLLHARGRRLSFWADPCQPFSVSRPCRGSSPRRMEGHRIDSR